MRSQGISQFYPHNPRSSANGMNHICLCLPSRSWSHLPTPEEWKAELTLAWWLLTRGWGYPLLTPLRFVTLGHLIYAPRLSWNPEHHRQDRN